MKVLIIAGSNYSEYSQGLIEFSEKAGHEVIGLVVRRALTWQRIKEEFSRERWGIITKFQKNFLKILGFVVFRKSGWALLLEENKIKPLNLKVLSAKKGIKYILVDDINSELTYEFVEEVKADVALFAGGGIIREKLLNQIPILNCHMGLLPNYRGSYPWVWAILNNEFDMIGITVHQMDIEIDHGFILKSKKIEITKLKDIAELETELEYEMVDAMIDGLHIFESIKNQIKGTMPCINLIKLPIYFMPHSSLYISAKEKFKQYKRIQKT